MGLCTRGIEAEPHGRSVWPRGSWTVTYPVVEAFDWSILIQLSIKAQNLRSSTLRAFVRFVLLLVVSPHGVTDRRPGGIRFTVPILYRKKSPILRSSRYESWHAARSRQVFGILLQRNNERWFCDRTWYGRVAMCKYSVCVGRRSTVLKLFPRSRLFSRNSSPSFPSLF